MLAALLAGVARFQYTHAEGLAQEACDTARPGAAFPAWQAAAAGKAREQGAKVIEWRQYGEQGVILSFTALLLDRYECVVSAREGTIRKAEVVFHD